MSVLYYQHKMFLMKRLALFLRKIFLIVYLLAIHLFAGIFVYEKFLKQYILPNVSQIENVKDPTETVAVPTPMPIPSIVAETTPETEQTTNQSSGNTNQVFDNANAAQSPQNYGKIMIPVIGIKREQIRDTYNDARSQGRVHNANDIMAAGGTPVVAAVDGEIAKFFDSERGGITIYQYSPDKHTVYYYAHLQKRADNLQEHAYVKQGTIIGYVGDSGNAGAGNYHLHFAVTILDDPKNIFKGTDINPYPLLKDGIEPY